MRPLRAGRHATILLVLLALAGPSHAGLYNTSEPAETFVDPTYLKFHANLLILRSLGMDKVEFDNPMRRRYMLQADLARRGAPGNLSVEQTLNLSTILVRRRQPDEAINLLRPLAAAQRSQFLIQSNLATAYFLSGQERRAIDTLEEALGHWPERWDSLSDEQKLGLGKLGWNEVSFRAFRQAEVSLLKLFKLRAREPKLKEANNEKLDDLFGIRYVGPSGAFEVGKIADEERPKLHEIVETLQMLINWLPYDDRLYWQLGEVMNAQGNLKAARMIFDELYVNRQYRAEEMRDHRREIGATPLPPEPEPDDPRWRHLGIAFGAGAIVALFASWQVREIRRRMQRRST